MAGSHKKYLKPDDIEVELQNTSTFGLSSVLIDKTIKAINQLNDEIVKCTKSFDEFKPGLFSKYNDHVKSSFDKLNPLSLSFGAVMVNYNDEIKAVPIEKRKSVHDALVKLKQNASLYTLSLIGKKNDIDPKMIEMSHVVFKDINTACDEESKNINSVYLK